MTLASLRKLFSPGADDADLDRARIGALTRQLPLLYFILIVNTMVTAYAFRHEAPALLTIYVPALLAVVCAARLAWWFSKIGFDFTGEEAARYLRHINNLTLLLAFFFCGWIFALYSYASDDSRNQIVYFLILNLISCAICLMHLRSAVLIITVCCNAPITLFFLFNQQAMLRAAAVNVGLVTIALIAALFTYSRDFSGLVMARRSLTRQQEATQRLSDENFRLANVDALTGLPNRRSFFAKLDKRLERAALTRSRLAVGSIDLDGFKPINDTFGHAVGDAVLSEVGRRLQKSCAGRAIIGRLGGDEFGLIIETQTENDSLLALGAKITRALSAPYAIGEAHPTLGCSIGFAVYPDMAEVATGLYERADYALYQAKRRRRGETVLFTREQESELRAYGVVEAELKRADFEQEMTLAYQPIWDIHAGRVVAFEALARWNSPVLGEVAPRDFIPVAEHGGHIAGMTACLLRKALAAAAHWPEDVKLSFNLSALDLADGEAAQRIMSIIEQSETPPRRIEFEITESALACDFVKAARSLVALRGLGAGLSLDGFGAGYSSLSQIHRLPLDMIKLDKGFVADICENKVSHKMLKAIQALCREMDLDYVVKGVEGERQRLMLAALGCRLMQGFHFATPMPGEAVADYLDSTRQAASA